jgi:hypothetical protein
MIMRQVRNVIAEVLDKTTLADLLRRVEATKQEQSRQPLMHHVRVCFSVVRFAAAKLVLLVHGDSGQQFAC